MSDTVMSPGRERAARMLAYEQEFKSHLPRRTFTIIRVDGKAFHSYTRGLNVPFDEGFTAAMTGTAIRMCEEIAGAICAYVQSDEISVLMSDLQGSHTEPWLGGVTAKVVSLSASIATAEFNRLHTHPEGRGPALFDARVFTIPDPDDVAEYFNYRYSDARRNSLGMVAHHHLGEKAILFKNSQDRIDMLTLAGVDLWSYPPGNLDGRFINKVETMENVTYTDRRGVEHVVEGVTRKVWTVTEGPDLGDPDMILQLLPTPDPGSGNVR